MPVLKAAIVTSVLMALGFGLTAIAFPHTVFGLLTNHADVTASMEHYVGWLLPLMEITAIAFMLEGYFIGLKQGAILRNGAWGAFGMGFMPLALMAWLTQNNHLLWSALILYMIILVFMLAWQVIKHQQNMFASLTDANITKANIPETF